MDVKKVALLIGALVIAVVTAVMAKSMFTGAGAEQANAITLASTSPVTFGSVGGVSRF